MANNGWMQNFKPKSRKCEVSSDARAVLSQMMAAERHARAHGREAYMFGVEFNVSYPVTAKEIFLYSQEAGTAILSSRVEIEEDRSREIIDEQLVPRYVLPLQNDMYVLTPAGRAVNCPAERLPLLTRGALAYRNSVSSKKHLGTKLVLGTANPRDHPEYPIIPQKYRPSVFC